MENQLNSAIYNAKRSAIRQYSALAKSTPGCISLTLGEPDFDTPEKIRREVSVSFDNHETHYIENNGLAALREKIAFWENSKNGMDYTADEVIVTAGATEALFVALFGIINPGDEVIIPTPAFVLYEEIIKLCRGVPVFLDTSADSFQISEEKLKECISGKTKAIILNTPNNPTGCVLNDNSLRNIYNEVKNKDIFVICDDVYRQLIYKEDYHSFTEFRDLRKQIILIQSFSKPYAMTGWRVGYLIADFSVKIHLELLHQFMVVSTPAPFQKACIEALDFDPRIFLETYKKRRRFILDSLNNLGMEVTNPEGAFYVFPSIKKYGMSSAEFCTRMIKEVGLAATPGSCFMGEGHIRLTYCYSDDILSEGMSRLGKFIDIIK